MGRTDITTPSEWADTFHKWGWEAAKARRSRDSNPYASTSRAYPLWEAGWDSYKKGQVFWPGRGQ